MEEMLVEEEQSSVDLDDFFLIETPSDNKASTNDDSQKTSLDKRISSLFGIPSETIRETSSINQSTLSDKRSKHNRSKSYTSAWIASQTSEEIPTSK
jgi:hypothetical protein